MLLGTCHRHSIDNKRGYLSGDPTFVQFIISFDELTPVGKLRLTNKGQKIANSLINDGFIRLDQETASLYLNSFLKTDSNISPTQAMSMLRKPPKHDFHLQYETNDKEATKENLDRKGLLLTPDNIL